MLTQNLRKQLRCGVNEAVRISWQDPMRGLVYLRGRCVDASQNGMRIKLHMAIPKQSLIAILADGMGFAGNASVRHVVRNGTNYVLGLELSHAIPANGIGKSSQPAADATRILTTRV